MPSSTLGSDRTFLAVVVAVWLLLSVLMLGAHEHHPSLGNDRQFVRPYAPPPATVTSELEREASIVPSSPSTGAAVTVVVDDDDSATATDPSSSRSSPGDGSDSPVRVVRPSRDSVTVPEAKAPVVVAPAAASTAALPPVAVASATAARVPIAMVAFNRPDYLRCV